MNQTWICHVIGILILVGFLIWVSSSMFQAQHSGGFQCKLTVREAAICVSTRTLPNSYEVRNFSEISGGGGETRVIF